MQKSRIEQYQEKLKERETNNDNYFLDRFSGNKLGKTLNLSNTNSLINQENQNINNFQNNRTLKRNVTPNINTKNNYNIIENNIFNNGQTGQNYNNIKNINNQNLSNNANNINYYNNQDNINNINQNSNFNTINTINNVYSRPRSQNKNKNNNIYISELTNDPYGNDYKGTGNLPRDKGGNIKEDMYNQNQMLKEIWAKEMQEKKMRKEKEKQRQKELDILEEERIKREIAEINAKEEEEKQIKKQNEEKVLQENAQLIQNKKEIYENGININSNSPPNTNNENDNYYNNQIINQDSNPYYNNNNLYNKESKYKNIDLNNIHFYRRNNNKNNQNKNMFYKNKIRNNNIYNNRKVNEFEFCPNPRQLEDSPNPQISKLKKEVNSGYMEISSLFKQLKNNVIEANQNRNKAEKQLKYITDEINKEKKYRLQLEKKKYEQMRPEEIYNNYYASVRDVDPIIYEKNETNLEQNNMSNLAKVGQNLIRLTSQSEFIPVGSNTYDNNILIGDNPGFNYDPNNNIALNNNNEFGENNQEIESETVFQPNEQNI